MLLAFRGVEVSEAALAGQADLDRAGLDPAEVAFLASQHGLSAEARQLDLAEIEREVKVGRFPIVLLDRIILDREFAVHAVVPIHLSACFVIFLDPLRGQRRVMRNKFEKAQRRVGGWAVVWSEQEE